MKMKKGGDLWVILKLLQISGLAPYVISKDIKHAKRSYVLGVYNLLLATCVMYNVFLAETDVRNNVDYPNKTFLIRISFDMVDVLENIHPCFVCIRCLIFTDVGTTVWFKIKRINAKLKDLNVEFDERKFKICLYTKTTLFVLLSALFLGTDIFLCSRLGIHYTYNYWILCAFPLVQNSIVEATFGSLALLLYQRFWTINEFLNRCFEYTVQCKVNALHQPDPSVKEKSVQNIILRDKAANKIYLPPTRNFKKFQVHPVDKFVRKKPPILVMMKNYNECFEYNFYSQKNIVKAIRSLKMIHFELFEVANDLNAMFGWTLLFIFATSFFGCTMNLYFVIIFHFRRYDVEQYLSSLSWMAMYLFKVLYFIVYSNKASKEARRTTDLLHLLLNQTDFTDTELQIELKAFCLQLSQCNVQFNAAGFFTVDSPVLFQFIVGILSNVVFIVQFDKINFSKK